VFELEVSKDEEQPMCNLAALAEYFYGMQPTDGLCGLTASAALPWFDNLDPVWKLGPKTAQQIHSEIGRVTAFLPFT